MKIVAEMSEEEYKKIKKEYRVRFIENDCLDWNEYKEVKDKYKFDEPVLNEKQERELQDWIWENLYTDFYDYPLEWRVI